MIQTCQQTYGKKVFLGVGGSTGRISFSGPDQANAFGDVLWDVFGPSGNVDPQLRPFGTVEVDGFDIGSSLFLVVSCMISYEHQANTTYVKYRQ